MVTSHHHGANLIALRSLSLRWNWVASVFLTPKIWGWESLPTIFWWFRAKLNCKLFTALEKILAYGEFQMTGCWCWKFMKQVFFLWASRPQPSKALFVKKISIKFSYKKYCSAELMTVVFIGRDIFATTCK